MKDNLGCLGEYTNPLNRISDLLTRKFGRLRLLAAILTSLFFITAYGQTAGDYQTNAVNVTFANAAGWQRYNGTAWVAAGSAPGSGDGIITVRNGHTATLTASKTLDQLVVDAGGIIVVNGGLTLTLSNGAGIDLDVSGTIDNSGTISLNSGSTISFNDEGVYYHSRNGGTIPVAAWDVNSTCEVRGMTTSNPGGLTQSFGNFVWNCQSQTSGSSIYNIGTGGSILGSLSIIHTGSSYLRLSAATGLTLDIGKDLNMKGGSFYISLTTGSSVVNIGGNLNIEDGILTTTNSSGSTTMNLTGDLIISGGQFREQGSGSTVVNLINQGGLQNIRRFGGTILNSIDFNVFTDVTIDFGASDYLDGNGFFLLNDGVTLRTEHPLGLNGSIQTAARSFSSSANYIFDGTTAQVTGTYLPSSVINLTIDNAAGVSLSGNVTVNGNLNLSDGVLNLNGNTLTISSTGLSPCTANGSVSGNAGSSFITNCSLPASLPKGTYYNLTINCPAGISLCGDVVVNGNLVMTSGDIQTDSFILYLANGSPASLVYTSGIIIGKFERYINTTSADYLFPIGRDGQGQTLTARFTNLTPGSLLVEFIEGDPGIAGLPLSEGGYVFDNVFTTGYWKIVAKNSLASTNYNLDLDATGFSTYTIQPYTRLFERTGSAGNWTLNGTHSAAAGNIVKRTGMTGISSLAEGTQLGIGGSGPRITVQPVSHGVCLGAGTSFSIVVDPSAVSPVTYKWYKAPATPLSDDGRISGTSTANLQISATQFTDDGDYYCIVTDGNSNTTRSNTGTLTVNPLPYVTFGSNYSREITINAASGGTGLTDFPVLISITDDDLKHSYSFGHIESIFGYDVIFTDENGNKLDHQLERYNPSTGEYIAWVRIPILSASSTTIIKMLYGDQGIISDPSVKSTWACGYQGVWHMGDDPSGTAPQLNDGAGSANGTSYGGMGSGNLVAGIAGNALYFDGSNDYFDVGTGILPNSVFTQSAWLKTGNQVDNNYHGFFGFDPGSTGLRAPSVWVYQNNRIHAGFGDGTWNSWITPGAVINPDNTTWNHVVVTFDGTDYILYVNGVNVYSSTSAAGKIPTSTPIRHIGRVDNYYRGILDEVRVMSRPLSSGWIATEYTNISNPTAFITVGPENSNNNLFSAGACNAVYPLNGFPAGGNYTCPTAPGSISGSVFNPSLAGAGVHTIIYTYTDLNGCVGSATRLITVTPAVPAPPVASDTEYCIDNVAGIPASGSNLIWYSDVGLSSPVGCGSPFVTGQTTEGTYTYYVTQTLNGCVSPATQVSLVISPLTVAGSVSGGSTICQGETTPTLTLLGNNGIVVQWQRRLDGGAWENITHTNTTYSEIPPSAGTWDYRAEVRSGSCSSAYSGYATVVVNPVPGITLELVDPVCNNETSFNLLYSGVTHAPTSYSITAGTPAMAGFVPVTDEPLTASPLQITIPSGVTEGTYQFIITVKNANGCVSTGQTFDVTVYERQIADAGPDQDLCGPLTATLAANTPLKGTGKWEYVSGPDGSPVFSDEFDPESDVTVTIIGTYVFTWTITYEVCTHSDQVTVVFHGSPSITCATPAASYNTDPGFCYFTVPDNSLNPSVYDFCGVASVVNDFTNTATLNGAQFPIGTTTITWTVRNISGYESTCFYDIVVEDNQPPVITVQPTDTTGYVDSSCEFVIPDYRGLFTVSDNCGTVNILQSPLGTTLSGHGTTQTITFTIDDGHGNTLYRDILLTLRDTIVPVITVQPTDTTGYVDSSCEFVIPDYRGLFTVSDNCGTVNILQSPVGTTLS
ncbi:MAG: DUF2341 domain-containing protein, partial [Bacteroidales bacterium]|nr:DUF2341 domain-containing protein [Bacteroidales bacterium]